MSQGRSGARALIYSHDSFGLGHLRRCRTIAHALVGRFPRLSVLILSGSPIIGSFEFRSRVDYVRVPGVIKLRDGQYTSLSLHIDTEETLSIREHLIKQTADPFQPDMFIVDKEPLGLRGEVHDTLKMLKQRGTRLVLGLRDVMDEPASLGPEWHRKRVMPALKDLYDEIWVYGLPQICDPLEGISVPRLVRRKMVYTGYLRREVPQSRLGHRIAVLDGRPYLLVTTGGGGDGEGLIDWVLSAYEQHPEIPHPALLVLGPFMGADRQGEFLARAERLANVEALTFEPHIEELVANAIGVVAMGGYNTFCEILSLDKPALIVPRTKPRMEQFIRASRAQALGLVRMVELPERPDPAQMAAALAELPHGNRPHDVVVPGLLDGLDNVARLAAPWLESAPRTQEPGLAEPRAAVSGRF